MKVFITEL